MDAVTAYCPTCSAVVHFQRERHAVQTTTVVTDVHYDAAGRRIGTTDRRMPTTEYLSTAYGDCGHIIDDTSIRSRAEYETRRAGERHWRWLATPSWLLLFILSISALETLARFRSPYLTIALSFPIAFGLVHLLKRAVLTFGWARRMTTVAVLWVPLCVAGFVAARGAWGLAFAPPTTDSEQQAAPKGRAATRRWFSQDCSVRSGPSKDSQAIGYVNAKDEYELLDQRANWLLVKTRGLEGWVGCEAKP